jgi:hypothetical protein
MIIGPIIVKVPYLVRPSLATKAFSKKGGKNWHFTSSKEYLILNMRVNAPPPPHLYAKLMRKISIDLFRTVVCKL